MLSEFRWLLVFNPSLSREGPVSERNYFFSVSFTMKTFEEIRTEVLELDDESQRRIRDEIDRNLRSVNAGIREAKRRAEAVARGEMKTVDGPGSLAAIRKLITH